jgi:DNA-binding NarL/FixJ family response regulator
MTAPITIMLVEDHVGYREVVDHAISLESAFELISQFGTAEIALRSLQKKGTSSTPDLVLLDLNLPGMSGLEAIPWIKDYAPKTEIIVLTQSDQESDVLNAIAQGASGYLLKSATVNQIKDAIHTVMDGGASLDPRVARFILDRMKARPVKEKPERALSERELEILTLLAEGLVKKMIADKLEISVTTVAYHVKHIYEKLNVMNAPAAINKAHRMGLLSNE